jgi:hypothetical protein
MAQYCCQNKAKELQQLQKRQSKVLWIILLINAVMFFVEFAGGIKAASLSLTGDSLDMLGDALVYGCSLYVIKKGKKAQVRSRSASLRLIGNAQRQYYVYISDRCICQSHLSIIGSNRPHSSINE